MEMLDNKYAVSSQAIFSICQGFFLVKFVLFFILIRYILGISLFFIFLEVFSWLRILFVLIL